jgi:hypothetical protein
LLLKIIIIIMIPNCSDYGNKKRHFLLRNGNDVIREVGFAGLRGMAVFGLEVQFS